MNTRDTIGTPNLAAPNPEPTKNVMPNPAFNEHQEEKWKIIEDHTGSLQVKFRLAEYNHIRAEIASATEETWKLERFCLLGVAALYSWTFTTLYAELTNGAGIWTLALIVPPLIILFCWMKCAALESNIRYMGDYIKSLEVEIAPEQKGWEHYYNKRFNKSWFVPEKVAANFWFLFFLASSGGSIAIAFFDEWKAFFRN